MGRLGLAAALTLLVIPALVACGRASTDLDSRLPPSVTPSPPAEGERLRQAAAKAQLERQRHEQERCLRERPEWAERMVALRRAESRLARLKGETYVPLPPPARWDEAAEARFRREDREADWQRHLREQEDWQRREQSRRQRWLAEHGERLAAAQTELNRQAQILRDRRADLFTAPNSIEFNPAVEDQLLRCRRPGTRPMGKTALSSTPPSLQLPLH